MSKEALKERIALTFKNNEKYTELFATSDNNVFTDEDLAKQHAIRLNDTTVTPYKREASKEDTKSEVLKAGVKDLPEALKAITELEVLEALLKEEEAAEKPRKGAITAINDRIAEVKTLALDVNLGEGEGAGTEGEGEGTGEGTEGAGAGEETGTEGEGDGAADKKKK